MSYKTNQFDSRIAEILQAGGVGLLPSDTIYGLSGRALDETAVKRLHSLKGRSPGKPFIVLISDIKMLDLLSVSKTEARAAMPYWPGALTIICPAPAAPKWLSLGTDSLAVRMPGNHDLLELIKLTGPLVSTSANIENQPPLNSAAEAYGVFGEQLDFYVDHGQLSGLPSTLIQIVDNKLHIIRQGAVKIDQ